MHFYSHFSNLDYPEVSSSQSKVYNALRCPTVATCTIEMQSGSFYDLNTSSSRNQKWRFRALGCPMGATGTIEMLSKVEMVLNTSSSGGPKMQVRKCVHF